MRAGGGLVEDQELDALRERLRDLDELLLADTQVADLGGRVLLGRPTRASFAASLLVLFQSIRPNAPLTSLLRKMFSAMER